MSFYRTDDPVRDAENYIADKEKELEKFPKCLYCKHHIQDDYLYEINDEVICEECLNQNFRKRTDDYVE